MRINKDKGIGNVIFIVEGQKFEFFKYLRKHSLTLSMDKITDMPKQIFLLQEEYYKNNATYQLVSLLTIALMELGIIIIEEQDECYDLYIPPKL